MKRNVYDQVGIFYNEGTVWEPIIRQEWVEGFLRQKAWQGIRDEKLKDTWYQLQNFIIYLNYADNDDLNEITSAEYGLAIEWLIEHIEDFKASLKCVRNFFNVLIDFYTYLFNKKNIANLEDLKNAADLISGGRRLNLVQTESMLNELRLYEEEIGNLTSFDSEISNDLGNVIAGATEGLMLKLGKYFHGEEFSEDFERALYLYIGPFEKMPEEAEDEFWLGFWDYFLFDYHLLRSDLKPLEYFNATNGEKLNPDEYRILQELLHAKFTVFYVNKIVNASSVECINLFTGETFSLPLLDFDYKVVKKLLFFGHIFPTGLVMINYLTSVEMSINLRRRIKEEVLRQKEIFTIQMPGATLGEFFKRHALLLRHTVGILITLSQVNVTPISQLNRTFPLIEKKRIPNQGVINILQDLTLAYGLSVHDQKLLEKMWDDFSQLNIIRVRKAATWAAAVFYAYTEINSINNVMVKELAKHTGITLASLYKNRIELDSALQLEAFDARYLSEEGFVISLFEQ